MVADSRKVQGTRERGQAASRETLGISVGATGSRPALETRGSALALSPHVRRSSLLTHHSLLLLALALVASALLGVGVGAVAISPLHLVQMVLNKTGLLHFDQSWASTSETILFQVRLPRVLGAALVGASLATAGVLFQGLLRNPLADPFLIGTSAGAGFGATLAMMLPFGVSLLGFGLISLLAFAGGLGSVLLVYQLSRVGGRTAVVNLLLAGLVVSSVLGYASSFLMVVSEHLQLQFRQMFTWMMGGISVNSWTQLAVVGPVVVVGVLLSGAFASSLNAFSLGEEGAAYVGVSVERDKRWIIALGALLSGAAVTLAGLVGFVGLVVPHMVRLTLGPNHRGLLPASALAGATFLVIADTLARTVLAPTELPVGMLTALVGGPFFLWLLRRYKREYRF